MYSLIVNDGAQREAGSPKIFLYHLSVILFFLRLQLFCCLLKQIFLFSNRNLGLVVLNDFASTFCIAGYSPQNKFQTIAFLDIFIVALTEPVYRQISKFLVDTQQPVCDFQ